MKQNQIQNLKKIQSGNFENIFNVYQEENGMYFYNLLQTISFPQNLPKNLFTSYTIKYQDTWPFISHKTLNNPNLWWLILLANNISNPLEPLIQGTNIKIPIYSVAQEIIGQISKT